LQGTVFGPTQRYDLPPGSDAAIGFGDEIINGYFDYAVDGQNRATAAR